MKHWKLFYNKPADQWTEALPLGNGELGAMVSGSIVDETISLNLDTLWSGNGSDKENPGKIHDWNSIRKDVFQGQYQSAEQKIKEQILGNWTECYLPAGTLHLHFMHESDEQGNVYQYARFCSCNSHSKIRDTKSFIFDWI